MATAGKQGHRSTRSVTHLGSYKTGEAGARPWPSPQLQPPVLGQRGPALSLGQAPAQP